MTRRPILLLAFATALFVARPAHAILEFTLGGSGAIAQDLDSHQGTLDGSAGIFLLPGIELGARQTVNYVDSDSLGTSWNGSTRGFLDFQLKLGPVAPFVGANFGYLYGDGVPDTAIAGPEGGLKLYFGENAFLFGRVEYQVFFDKGDPRIDAITDGQLVYSLGIGFRL